MFKIFKKKTEFPFKESLDTAVFSCKCVMRENKDLLYVAHDQNSDWHFFCKDCGNKIDLDKIMIVSLEDVARNHIKILDLANLEIGKFAIAEGKDTDWLVRDIEKNEYHEWLKEIKNKIDQINKNRNDNVLRSDFSGVRIKR